MLTITHTPFGTILLASSFKITFSSLVPINLFTLINISIWRNSSGECQKKKAPFQELIIQYDSTFHSYIELNKLSPKEIRIVFIKNRINYIGKIHYLEKKIIHINLTKFLLNKRNTVPSESALTVLKNNMQNSEWWLGLQYWLQVLIGNRQRIKPVNFWLMIFKDLENMIICICFYSNL